MATFQATIPIGSDLLMARGVRVVRHWPGTTPIRADLVSVVPCAILNIASVTVLSATSIQVNFEKPAVNNAALNNIDNYLINPPLTVYSVVPEAVTDPTYVVLTIDEQVTGTLYEVTLSRIEAA